MLSERQPRARIARAVLGTGFGLALLAVACETAPPPAAPSLDASQLKAVMAELSDSMTRGEVFARDEALYNRLRRLTQKGTGLMTPPQRDGPAAVYPPLLRQAGIEGDVIVEVTVDGAGVVDPESVRVVWSTNRAFERPAVDAVRQSTFRPATRDGNPVAVTAQIPVLFRLEGESGPGPVMMTVTPPGPITSSVLSPRR